MKWVEENNVEPVVLSTLCSEVLEVVNDSVNATKSTLCGIEAVRHDFHVDSSGHGIVLDALHVSERKSFERASIELRFTNLDPNGACSLSVPSEFLLINLAVSTVEANETLSVDKLHLVSLFSDSLLGVG